MFRQKVVVESASPYPARPVRKRPRWWIRLRGLIGLSVLTVVLGLMLAASIGVVMVLLAVWMLTSLT